MDATPPSTATSRMAIAFCLAALMQGRGSRSSLRLLQRHQAADHRARTGSGAAIDHEGDGFRVDRHRVGAARLERNLALGKVVELSTRRLHLGEIDIVAFTLDVE